jgi:flagella basal body P-ring formation protein FlgA
MGRFADCLVRRLLFRLGNRLAPLFFTGLTVALLGLFAVSLQARAAEGAASARVAEDPAWRIRIVEAAVIAGPMVTLGEIAAPVGDIDANLWRELAARPLWTAPEENGRPVNLTRPRLQQAMLQSMGQDFASLCLYPPALALQRGGRVLAPAEMHDVVVKTLTPLLAALPGEAQLSDFRLPATVFLTDAKHRLELEEPQNLTPGRLSLRFVVRELDGSVNKRLTGTVFIDCWALVPCANLGLSKDETLDPGKVTFMRKNLAQVRGEIWDGKGGPWRITRPIPIEQPIMVSDLTYLPTVERGSVITLVYQAKTVRLSVKAEALESGVKGESIPLRNLSSKKQVYATIVDAGTAVIDSGFSSSTAYTQAD